MARFLDFPCAPSHSSRTHGTHSQRLVPARFASIATVAAQILDGESDAEVSEQLNDMLKGGGWSRSKVAPGVGGAILPPMGVGAV